MRLLTQCKAKGSYEWQRTTLATDTVEIRNEDDLYAKLPLGAASLEGELKSSGRLAVRTTVAGQMKLKDLATSDVPRDGDCAGATHVVSGLSVGAFKLLAGGDASAKAGAGVGGVGIGGSTSSEEMLVKEAGDPAKCGEANDEHPASACQSPIQMFLWPLPKKADAMGSDDSETPPSPDAIRVNFSSEVPAEKWRVMEGDKVLCDVPCARWVKRDTDVLMRLDGETPADVRTVELPKELRAYSTGRTVDAVVRAERRATRNAAAVVGLGGLACMGVGAIGTAVGVATSKDEELNTLSYVAIATMVVGIPLLITGVAMGASSHEAIDLTLAPNQTTSRPRLHLGPGVVTADTGGASNVSMTLGPGFLSGQF